MTLTKNNICVLIHNKTDLTEVKNILQKYNQKTGTPTDMMISEVYRWLLCTNHDNSWYIGSATFGLPKITLFELETILQKELK